MKLRAIPALWVLLTSLLIAACGGIGDEGARAPGAAATHDKARAAAAEPVAPFAGNGWYWNPQEGGTGFMVEAQGSRMFIGFFMYEEGSGNPVWYVATGDLANGTAPGDHRFSGDLLAFRGGMGLHARTWTAPTSRSLGTVTIDFAGGRARVAFPGGRVMQAERFCANGTCTTDTARSPNTLETGWYWNPAEGGRGVAVETHGGRTYVGLFHYNPDGSPVWHIVSDDAPAVDLYTGGQSLTSAHRAGRQDVLSPIHWDIQDPCSAQWQVPGGPPITLQRFVIDDTRPAASACAALATLADLPDLSFGLVNPVTRGGVVHGMIDRVDDGDAYSILLFEGERYTFELRGAASRSGTLVDPQLSLHDGRLAVVAENDNRDAATTDARISLVAPTTGTYYLRVRSSTAHPGAGSFQLAIDGVADTLVPPRPRAVSDFQGALVARLRGAVPARVSMTVSDNGTVSGLVSVRLPGVQPATYQHAPLSGTVTAEGLLSITGHSPLIGPLNCMANLSSGAVFGGCGDAGMLAGDTFDRTRDAYGPIVVPASAIVGQPVQFTTSGKGSSNPSTDRWQLGDGGRAVGVSPVHVYATPGHHRIQVAPGTGQLVMGQAPLMVFCTDGTLCTDVDEPAPSITLDAAACALQDIPPDRMPPFIQAPAITFSGRATGSSALRMRVFASATRRTSMAELRNLPLPLIYDQASLRAECGGRDPCEVGPFGAFTHSTSASSAGELGPAWGLQALLTEPREVWLYLVLLDRAYSRVLGVVEQPLTCPGHVKPP